jgi:transmembrane sensor
MDGSVVTNRPLKTSRAIRAEAAAWIARLHSDSRTSQDERGFQDWLAARAEHEAAYKSLMVAWDSVREVPRERRSEASQESFLMRRRAVLASVGSLAVVGLGLLSWRASFAGVYETGIGEQRHVALGDGTEVFLDADSRIRVRFDHHRRVIELQKGRANFRVAADSTRPFVVQAVDRQIIADQSTFDVRRDGDQVTVVMARGQASVGVGVDDKANARSLTAGERLIATSAEVKIDEPNLPRLVAWQSGQAIFDNDTLEDAAREMNRYSTVVLSVAKPVASELRLSGVYRVGDNETFARSVAVLLPIKVVEADGKIQLVADTKRWPAR